MHHDERSDREDINGLDLLVNRVAQSLGRRSSRRSMLGRTAGFLFMVMGLEQSQILPIIRKARGALDPGCTQQGCAEGDPKYCGMQGKPCSTCTSNFDPEIWGYQHIKQYYWDLSGDCPVKIYPTPPAGYVQPYKCGSWTACCGTSAKIYIDCCAPNSTAEDFGINVSCPVWCCNQNHCWSSFTTKATAGATYCKSTDCSAAPALGDYYVCTALSEPTGGCGGYTYP